MANDSAEIYVKENNLLQLGLFYFGKKNPPKQIITEWSDSKGNYKLTCTSKYTVPGGMEQDVFTATMRIWVKRGMPSNVIEVNYSEIARELNLKPSEWNKEIKKSLDRLGQARYELQQCFVEAGENGERKQVDAHFSLYNSLLLFSKGKDNNCRRSKSLIEFHEAIRKNLEAKYYQILDIKVYRSLPSGLSRRLYEFLEKRRYHNIKGIFKISEELICRWLPVNDKHVTNRRKTLTKTAQPLIDKGYLSSYEFDKNKKLCIYTYASNLPSPNIDIIDIQAIPPKTPQAEFYDTVHRVAEAAASNLPAVATPQANVPPTHIDSAVEKLCELMRLKRIPKTIKPIVADYVRDKGFDYVKNNILYANEKAKRNYSSYLQQALAKNWAAVWAEETQMRLDFDAEQRKEEEQALLKEMDRRKAEEEAKKQREAQLAKEREEFVSKAKQLPKMVRTILKEKAIGLVPDAIPKNSSTYWHIAKIHYGKFVLDCFNEEGTNFDKDVTEGDAIDLIWQD